MKARYLLLFLVTLPFSGANSQTLMTWNIRYNNPGDGVNAWLNRKERVFTLIKEVNPDIFCLQEALNDQVTDFNKAFPAYGWAGAGRDDGKTKGEYVPIFYRKDRYKVMKSGNLWLSETPGVPGKLGWDAVCPRMITWVCLQDKSGKSTFVFNTHFDHIGQVARTMSAKLLIHAADSLAGGNPAVITGDFNTTPADAPYTIITGAGYQDSRLVSKGNPSGPEYTFTGFPTSGKPGDRIDFIYLKNSRLVRSYQTKAESFDGNYLSDHLPVIIQFYNSIIR